MLLNQIFPYTTIRGISRVVITFPDNLCVHDHQARDNCIYLLETIRVKSFSENGIHIDLSQLEKMSAAGAVALFAYITSIQISKHANYFTFELPSNRAMRQKFRNSGLWYALKGGGARKLDKLWSSNNRFKSGYNPDVHLDRTLELLKKQVDIPHRLQEAINEAVLNIVQHAYKATPGSKTRWWQYAFVNKSKTNFIYVICDRGQTIPRSFKNLKLEDPDAIIHAMTKGVSSTGKAWRGKGSRNLQKPVQKEDNDKLIVLSRNGLYKYVSESQPIETSMLAYPFYGTLVAWSFAL